MFEYPDKLLKKATAAKKKGNVDEAIELLRKAYKEIEKTTTIYPIEYFLRLPLYLQAANRNDEAWREFNILLTKGYPNQMKHPDILPMEHSIIYDKMRLFLQRESKFDLAVGHGILSYISWAIGLFRQNRETELSEYISKEHYEKVAKDLLKKANKEYLFEELSKILEQYLKRLPNINLGELLKDIDKTVY